MIETFQSDDFAREIATVVLVSYEKIRENDLTNTFRIFSRLIRCKLFNLPAYTFQFKINDDTKTYRSIAGAPRLLWHF